MRRISAWFAREPKTPQAFAALALGFLMFHLAQAWATIRFAEYAGITFSGSSAAQNLPPYPSFALFSVLVVAAAAEEFMFRLVPMFIAADFVRHRKWLLLLIAVPVSMVFGYLHGGMAHILLQGVGGIIYTVVYLKCGGWNYNPAVPAGGSVTGNPLQAVIMSTIVHVLYNVTLLTLDHFLPGVVF